MVCLATTEILGNIAVVRMDNPPVNALGAELRQSIEGALSQIQRNEDIRAVILTGTGRFFSAGADIKEFGKPPLEPFLPDLINQIASYPLPTFAVINGTALGGGLELALGCKYRFSAPNVKIGLPEVNLGLIPGAGGTQRLPRIIGTQNAAEIICKGKPISAKSAHNIGLIDAIFQGDLIDQACKHIRSLLMAIDAGTHAERPSMAEHVFEDEIEIDYWLAQFKIDLERKSRGQVSPLKALKAVSIANYVPLEEGLKREREIFQECMESDQRQGLIHAFFVEREVTKLPQYEDVEPLPVKSVGILGAGTMGVGISIAFASKGFAVSLFDIDAVALEKAKTRITETLENNVAKGRMSEADGKTAKAAMGYKKTLAELSDCDLIIEAVVERMDIKTSVFRDLDALLKPSAIMASNTSYLDINEIASVTKREEKVIGLHFFSPANIMKLLEVVKTDKASVETMATALSVAKAIGKTPVIAGMCDGFIGNRIFKTYRKQAEYLVEDGALPQDVDRVMTEFGFAMGPFAVSDLAGLDIGWHTRRREDATRPKAERYTDMADRLYDLGRLGQKSGAGWYKYEAGNRQPIVDEKVEALILKACAENNITRRNISDDEIRNRVLFAMINEGANILHEGIANRALDIDVVYLQGYGFPRYRGGPMFYADSIGANTILDQINQFAKLDPYTWQPSPLLETLSRLGSKFHDINK